MVRTNEGGGIEFIVRWFMDAWANRNRDRERERLKAGSRLDLPKEQIVKFQPKFQTNMLGRAKFIPKGDNMPLVIRRGHRRIVKD